MTLQWVRKVYIIVVVVVVVVFVMLLLLTSNVFEANYGFSMGQKNSLRAFCYNSTESELIWMKFGAL